MNIPLLSKIQVGINISVKYGKSYSNSNKFGDEALAVLWQNILNDARSIVFWFSKVGFYTNDNYCLNLVLHSGNVWELKK